MVAIAQALSASAETYYADRLEEGAAVLAARGTARRSAAFIAAAAQDIRGNYEKLSSTPSASTANQIISYTLHDSLSIATFAGEKVAVNGIDIPELLLDTDHRVVEYLGTTSPFDDGLNTIEQIGFRSKVTIWLEDGLIRKFDNPYQNSYALIVAIDNYESLTSGYDDLGKMFENAELLIKELERKGFPRENILTLRDEEATSAAIETHLKEFWRGGKHADADRLLFYFGGHGDYTTIGMNPNESNGVLITADYDPVRPTSTGLLMEDLTFRHFRNIVSNHVVMLIDACSAGLALPRFQSTDAQAAKLGRFKKYVVLRNELDRPARNILVAGTGEQRALYSDGGIFTTAVVEALAGKADMNDDRIVDFDELAIAVTDMVRTRAADVGVNQEPAAFKATKYGKGNVLFFDQ